MVPSSLRVAVDGITWKRVRRGACFMLTYSTLCIVFSLVIGWFEMKMLVTKQGPGYRSEFIGMYLVVGLIFGQFSCALAFPAHALIYLKAPRHRTKWYAASASLIASTCVWLFFNLAGAPK